MLPRVLHAVLLYRHVRHSDGYVSREKDFSICKRILFLPGDTSPNATAVAVPAHSAVIVDQVDAVATSALSFEEGTQIPLAELLSS